MRSNMLNQTLILMTVVLVSMLVQGLFAGPVMASGCHQESEVIQSVADDSHADFITSLPAEMPSDCCQQNCQCSVAGCGASSVLLLNQPFFLHAKVQSYPAQFVQHFHLSQPLSPLFKPPISG